MHRYSNINVFGKPYFNSTTIGQVKIGLKFITEKQSNCEAINGKSEKFIANPVLRKSRQDSAVMIESEITKSLLKTGPPSQDNTVLKVPKRTLLEWAQISEHTASFFGGGWSDISFMDIYKSIAFIQDYQKKYVVQFAVTSYIFD